MCWSCNARLEFGRTSLNVNYLVFAIFHWHHITITLDISSHSVLHFSWLENLVWKSGIAWQRSMSIFARAMTMQSPSQSRLLHQVRWLQLLQSGNETSIDVFNHQWDARLSKVSKFTRLSIWDERVYGS